MTSRIEVVELIIHHREGNKHSHMFAGRLETRGQTHRPTDGKALHEIDCGTRRPIMSVGFGTFHKQSLIFGDPIIDMNSNNFLLIYIKKIRQHVVFAYSFKHNWIDFERSFSFSTFVKKNLLFLEFFNNIYMFNIWNTLKLIVTYQQIGQSC